MPNIVKTFFVLICTILLASSCSSDFLDENIKPDQYPVGGSNIYLSPDWAASNYQFSLPSADDGDFKIVSKPAWLNAGTLNGKMHGGVAVLHCSASKSPLLSSIGIHMDYMTVMASGRNFKVPVGYITEGSPKIDVARRLNLWGNSYNQAILPIRNAGEGILMWDIPSMPDWLTVDTARLTSNGLFITPYASYDIPFLMKTRENMTGILTGTVVLATNDKENPNIDVEVIIDFGEPQMYLYGNKVVFSPGETSKPYYFNNSGTGVLVWEFEGMPEWLSISPSKGVCRAYGLSSDIKFYCDLSKLMPGQNTALVNLKSNDKDQPSVSISVMAFAPGDNSNIVTVDGHIVDVAFNKNTGVLYYLTSDPHRLNIFDINAREVLGVVELAKDPTCFAISEDWLTAAVGHYGAVSAVNLSNRTKVATHSIDYSVNDIAWAENDWYAFTQKGGSDPCLHWVNLADGSCCDAVDNTGLDGSTIVKKVPTQPYLVATRNVTFPTGFYAYDIAGKVLKSYSHMDLTDFWFSDDGRLIFAKNTNIYRTSSSTGSDNTFNTKINPVGKINTGGNEYYGLKHLFYGANSLWVLQNESSSSDTPTALYQVEREGYSVVKRIPYDFLYQPDGASTFFSVSANYAFANREESEIAVLCKGINNDSWVIQFVLVE